MYWYEGKFIDSDTLEVNIKDPGLLYGATVFTTMRVYQKYLDHPLTHWQEHCDRLRHSLEVFGWQLPNWDNLRKGSTILSSYFPILRIAVFADGRELITGRYLPEDLRERQTKGIVVWMAKDALYRRCLTAHKTGNYLGAILALQQAQRLGAQEAILIDEIGNWLETSTGNLWGWKDNCWWTPSLDTGILPGIIRSKFKEWLQTKNIPLRETIWNQDFVRDLESIAYSNCAIEIIPIHTVIGAEQQINFNVSFSALEALQSYFTVE